MRDLQALIVERAVEDDRFRERVGETLELHGLLDHPGWHALKKHFENGKQGYGSELAARIMSGEVANQRDIDYMRGCKEMAEAIFSYPESALAQLERTARQLMQGEFERAVAQEQLESPYIDNLEV